MGGGNEDLLVMEVQLYFFQSVDICHLHLLQLDCSVDKEQYEMYIKVYTIHTPYMSMHTYICIYIYIYVCYDPIQWWVLTHFEADLRLAACFEVGQN